jgi:hypothetical protein
MKHGPALEASTPEASWSAFKAVLIPRLGSNLSLYQALFGIL